ncbi:MAG TPA: hypothetical protein VF676_11065 [Flavobacterium sp.]
MTKKASSAKVALNNLNLVENILISDINNDKIQDTIAVVATPVNSERLGYNLKLKIKYSGGSKVVNIDLENEFSALQWAFDTRENWISIGYSDGVVGKYFDISYDLQKDQFFLRYFYSVNFRHHINQIYDVFDQGKITVKLEAFKVCKAIIEKPIYDTVEYSPTKSDECIELPYFPNGSGRSEGALFSILSLPPLKNIN